MKHPDEAEDLLRAAFEAARERDAALVVLHAWWLTSGHDDAVVDQTALDGWEARARRELAPVLDRLMARYPTVDTTVDVRHAPPVEAVLAAAARSELLVIGQSPVPVLMIPEPERVLVTGPRDPR